MLVRSLLLLSLLAIGTACGTREKTGAVVKNEPGITQGQNPGPKPEDKKPEPKSGSKGEEANSLQTVIGKCEIATVNTEGKAAEELTNETLAKKLEDGGLTKGTYKLTSVQLGYAVKSSDGKTADSLRFHQNIVDSKASDTSKELHCIDFNHYKIKSHESIGTAPVSVTLPVAEAATTNVSDLKLTVVASLSSSESISSPKIEVIEKREASSTILGKSDLGRRIKMLLLSNESFMIYFSENGSLDSGEPITLSNAATYQLAK